MGTLRLGPMPDPSVQPELASIHSSPPDDRNGIEPLIPADLLVHAVLEFEVASAELEDGDVRQVPFSQGPQSIREAEVAGGHAGRFRQDLIQR